MATSPPTNVKPTAPAGSSGWVLEAKGNDPGSLNISRDISTGANQSITVRPGTQFRMKPSGKSKVDKNAETAQTAKWGDDLLVTVPGAGQVLLKGFYNKGANAPPSKMVIEQKNGMLRKVEGRPGAEPSDSPNPTAQEDKDGNTVAGDAQDAQFADFNVWQDANQDGVSDAGEVKTLAELGLSSFQLISDGVARTPEVGVHEAGRTSATATDGSQVLVADVGFDFGTLAKLDLSADPVANTLALHLDDLLANPHLTLVVQGAANDAVKLQGDGWVNSGSTVTLGDHHYTVWNNSTAQLLIDQQLVNNGRVL